MKKQLTIPVIVSLILIGIALTILLDCSWDIITVGKVSEDPADETFTQPDTVYILVPVDSLPTDSLTNTLEGGVTTWHE